MKHQRNMKEKLELPLQNSLQSQIQKGRTKSLKCYFHVMQLF
ncbi:hypothetical protein NC651_004065 [Populus alba x Populus x berolinensis]|nr:hypothetical protein NC651_004065 [Populus alba x Populus x berolinensis]